MVTLAPRIDTSLVDELVRIDDGRTPIAELCRRVGTSADERGLTRPSYECVRKLVHFARELRAEREPSRVALVLAEAARRSAYWAAFDAVLRGMTGRG